MNGKNSFVLTPGLFRENLVNAMAIDALAPYVARASAATVLIV